jgi:hypothetical protein
MMISLCGTTSIMATTQLSMPLRATTTLALLLGATTQLMMTTTMYESSHWTPVLR